MPATVIEMPATVIGMPAAAETSASVEWTTAEQCRKKRKN
jgi:hypothetical protein